MHTIGHTLAAICINVVLITVFTHTHVTMSFTSPSSHIHVTFSFSTLHHSLSLSVLTAIFQVYPGQPVFTEAKDGDWWRWWRQLDYWSHKPCKAPVKLSPPANQHPVFTGRMPFLSSNQQCQSTEGKPLFTTLGQFSNEGKSVVSE